MATLENNTITGILNILPEDDITVYTNDGGGVYQQFRIRNHYEKDRQTYQMGIASPSGFGGKSVAAVQLCSPTLLWICNWTVGRSGDPPLVPDPSPSVSDWILLDDWWDPDQIEVAGTDGQALYYRVSGTYIYSHPNPPANTNAAIIYPLTPWINSSMVTVNLRTIDSTMLTKGLSDATGSTVGKTLGNITTTGSGSGGASGQGLVH